MRVRARIVHRRRTAHVGRRELKHEAGSLTGTIRYARITLRNKGIAMGGSSSAFGRATLLYSSDY